MHDVSRTWHIDAVINDGCHGVWGRPLSLTLYKRSGESRDHVMLKLLGAVFCAGVAPEVNVVVEPPLRVDGYTPDVVAMGDDVERPRLWVECGDTAVYKLDRLSRALGKQTPIMVLKKGRHIASALRTAMDETMARPRRAVVVGFDASAIDALGDAMSGRRAALVVTVAEADADASVAVDGDVAISVSVDGVVVDVKGVVFA